MKLEFTENPFEVLTRRRFAAMDLLLGDHVSRCGLQAASAPRDPDIVTVHQRALATRTAWNIAYLKWAVGRRTQKGRTFAVNQLIGELRGKQINLWQVMVQQTGLENHTWLKGTEFFEKLFPDGRRPFQQGAVEARLAAVSDLANALNAIPSLTNVAEAVRTFHTALATAQALQRETHASGLQASADLEIQRKLAAATLYRNMARLMEKYADTPATVWNFFDRKLAA